MAWMKVRLTAPLEEKIDEEWAALKTARAETAQAEIGAARAETARAAPVPAERAQVVAPVPAAWVRAGSITNRSLTTLLASLHSLRHPPHHMVRVGDCAQRLLRAVPWVTSSLRHDDGAGRHVG